MSDLLGLGHWYAIKDGDMRLRDLLNRHYSARHYRDGRKVKLSIGPGFKIALMTADGRAAWAWRKFKDDSGQVGINNAIFHNESDVLSSELILEAEKFAWARWPGERLYTYVNPGKIKSANPGYCYKMAGWRKCGVTKSGQDILEKLPR